MASTVHGFETAQRRDRAFFNDHVFNERDHIIGAVIALYLNVFVLIA